MKDNKPKTKAQDFQFPKFQADYLRRIYEFNHGVATELLKLNLESKGIKMEQTKNG